MKLGLVLPQTELHGPDDIALLVRTAEECGLSYLVLYDHVLGADRVSRPDWTYSYDSTTPLHEPFVTFGYAAALCSLELVTGVLVLPQRQTVLVAQQAAELDVLSRGRVRLGVGIGWNKIEFEALGVEFSTRAARFEEQIDVLRRLWSEETLTYRGQFHTIDRAGLCPRPVQRPIPLWIGGGTKPKTLERIARLGDGWICYLAPGPEAAEAWRTIQASAERHGRSVGLQATIQPGGDHVTAKSVGQRGDVVALVIKHYRWWRDLGATHISLSGLGVGRSPQEHAEFIEIAIAALRTEQ